jgi:NTP pyrophosphatase (non-canonical NTP hydrolase)
MSDPRFLQEGFDKKLAHLVEECGEVLAAAGKTQRWGLECVNPLLPVEEQETNRNWLLREIKDLQATASRLLVEMGEENLEEKYYNAVDEDLILSHIGVASGDPKKDLIRLAEYHQKIGTEQAAPSETCKEKAETFTDQSETVKETAKSLHIPQDALDEWDLSSVGKTPQNEILYAVDENLDNLIRKALTQPDQSGWMPIESAPKDGNRFLAYEKTEENCIYEAWWEEDYLIGEWGEKVGGFDDDWDLQRKPTHWMPLPKPPQHDESCLSKTEDFKTQNDLSVESYKQTDQSEVIRDLAGLLQETQQRGAYGLGSTLAERIQEALTKHATALQDKGV